jgi:hypothetical protein
MNYRVEQRKGEERRLKKQAPLRFDIYKQMSNSRESGRDGNLFGELMAMRFSRPDSPEISLQADLVTANSLAINAIRC